MPDPSQPVPTDAELQILRVLWDQGPCTARQVHEALYGDTEVGYTTALKLLQNMTGKHLVSRFRPSGQRHHLYCAAVDQQPTVQRVVQRFVDRTFKGSGVRLAMHALDVERTPPEELEELRRMVERLQEEQDGA